MLKEYLDEDDNLIVYRGFNDHNSIDLNYSISWSTNKEHSKLFGTESNKLIINYFNTGFATAKVNIKDVVLYVQNKKFMINEHECILSPIKEFKELIIK